MAYVYDLNMTNYLKFYFVYILVFPFL